MSDREEPTTSKEVKMIQIPVKLPMPSPLVMTGNLATNWKWFYRAWNNYEIAARLKDSSNLDTNTKLRTATLLTCSGADALHVFDGLDFANEDERKGIDAVVAIELNKTGMLPPAESLKSKFRPLSQSFHASKRDQNKPFSILKNINFGNEKFCPRKLFLK